MTGNNELKLNTTTMIQILQEWVDDNMSADPLYVVGIVASDGYTFTVSLSDTAPNPTPATITQIK